MSMWACAAATKTTVIQALDLATSTITTSSQKHFDY